MNLFSLSPAIKDEIMCSLCDRLLGEGVFRSVYSCRVDPELVIKIDHTDSREFCNIQEWTIWQEVQCHTRLSLWFAPCIWISDYGSVLVQRRTAPLSTLPKRAPSILADVHLSNWGLLDGRPVMHDYANNSFYEIAKREYKMVSIRSLQQ